VEKSRKEAWFSMTNSHTIRRGDAVGWASDLRLRGSGQVIYIYVPTAFANCFTINSAVHLYNTRMHLDFASTNYGKRTVRYKASKIGTNCLHL